MTHSVIPLRPPARVDRAACEHAARTRIRWARCDAGLTQPEMARALGVDERTVRHWEAGTKRVPAWAILACDGLRRAA